MFATHALRIELHRAGAVTTFDIQDDRALIGSGSHCDVRLAPDEAAVEQLLVELVGDDVYLRARALKPPCLLNGAPFLDGRIAATALAEFGGVGICVARVARQDTKIDARAGRQASTSPAVQLLGIVAIALGLYAVSTAPALPEGSALTALTPPAPAPLPQDPCPQTELHAARAWAEQLQAEADTKRERAPFYPGDAVAGAPLFERAARCYEAAGATERAREAHALALALRAQTADQIHLAHIRLERGLLEGNDEVARQSAALALALVANPLHPYAQWLLAVKREGLLRAEGARR